MFRPPYGHLAERERALRPRTNGVEPMCHFCRGPGILMGPGRLDAPDDRRLQGGKYRDAILLHSFRFGSSKPCHCRLPLTRLASTIRTSSFLVPFPIGTHASHWEALTQGESVPFRQGFEVPTFVPPGRASSAGISRSRSRRRSWLHGAQIELRSIWLSGCEHERQ